MTIVELHKGLAGGQTIHHKDMLHRKTDVRGEV